MRNSNEIIFRTTNIGEQVAPGVYEVTMIESWKGEVVGFMTTTIVHAGPATSQAFESRAAQYAAARAVISMAETFGKDVVETDEMRRFDSKRMS